MQMDRERFALEMEELIAKIGKLKADTTLSMAKAESELNEDALAYYKTEVEGIVREADLKIAMMKEQAQAQMQMQMAAQQGGAGGLQANKGRVSGVAHAPRGAGGMGANK